MHEPKDKDDNLENIWDKVGSVFVVIVMLKNCGVKISVKKYEKRQESDRKKKTNADQATTK